MATQLKARRELAGLPVYEPGRAAPRGAIKLASNENPYGPSPSVRKTVRSFRGIERYPDGGASRLRAALAGRLGVRPDQILAGAGSDEIGDFLARAYLRPGDAVVYPKYTFIRYAMAAQAAGARRIETRVLADFSIDLSDLIRTVRAASPRMVCVANPNNPTGAYIPRRDLQRFLNAVSRKTLVVLDEAYFEYASLTPDYPDGVRLAKDHSNLVVLRTFSKIYGMASLRVGYAVAHPSVIAELHKVRPPFNVNAIGQAAAESALADRAHVRRCARLNALERERLSQSLSKLGFQAPANPSNFLLVGLPIRLGGGRAVFKKLAAAGVIVRPLDPYGLPRHIRVTVGTRAENNRLMDAMRRLVREA